MSKPRDRQHRLARKDGVLRMVRDFVGKDEMPKTCPRCGWPCTHLVSAYYESPWNEYGGMCSQCCQEAARAYDAKGSWPEDPRDKVIEKPTENVEKLGLFDQ